MLSERAIGDGPNLTLVHGWGLGSAAWAPVAALLARDFTVHLIDLPGYGGSAETEDNGIEALADALAAAIPPRSMLCGWSLGAMVCLACAARHPRQVARLVLAAPTASFVQRDGWSAALPAARLQSFIDRLDADPAALLRHFLQLVNHGDGNLREAVRALRPCLGAGLPAPAATLRAGLRTLGSADLRVSAMRVAQPTLLIHGGADSLMPPAASTRLADLLIEAKLDIFAGSAHAPFASDPERFAAAVRRFAGVSE